MPIQKYALLIIGSLLFLDGAILLLWRKIHLGTILPFLIGLIFLALVFFDKTIQNFLTKKLIYQKIYRTIWGLFFVWVLSLAVFFVFISKQSFNAVPNNIQAMIILGSQVKNGKPSSALQARLDKGLELSAQYHNSPIIVTGGIGFGNSESEAEVMGKYLIDNGIDNTKIIYENKSTSTELNLKNSIALMASHHIHLTDNIAIVTNDFHCLRASLIAKKLGYTNAVAISAPMPIATRYNSWLREYFAFVVGWVLNEY